MNLQGNVSQALASAGIGNEKTIRSAAASPAMALIAHRRAIAAVAQATLLFGPHMLSRSCHPKLRSIARFAGSANPNACNGGDSRRWNRPSSNSHVRLHRDCCSSKRCSSGLASEAATDPSARRTGRLAIGNAMRSSTDPTREYGLGNTPLLLTPCLRKGSAQPPRKQGPPTGARRVPPEPPQCSTHSMRHCRMNSGKPRSSFACSGE